MGRIKKLHFNEILGGEIEGNKDLYPITHTDAVFDDDGNCLTDLLKGIGTGGGSTTGVRKIVYKVGISVEDILLESPLNVSNLGGRTFLGSYNFTTGEFTPPSGWSVSDNLEIPEGQWMFYSEKVFLEKDDTNLWSDPIRLDSNNNTNSGNGLTKYIYAVANTMSELPPLTNKDNEYNWDTGVLTPPANWSVDSEGLAANMKEGQSMYFAYKNFLKGNNNTKWQGPFLMFLKADVAESDLIKVYAAGESATTLWQSYCLNDIVGKGKGTYNFKTLTLSLPSPLNTVWSVDVDTIINSKGKNENVYESVKRFYTNDLTLPWSMPTRYIVPGEVIASSATNTTSFGTALYKAVSATTSTVVKPDMKTLTIELLFDFSKGLMIMSSTITLLKWALTPAAAMQLLEEKNAKIWVSYNNYFCDFSEGNPIPGTGRSTGWSDPVPYVDIDGILKTAEENSEKIALEAIANSLEDFENALAMLEAALASVAAVIDSIKILYDWVEIFASEFDGTNAIGTTYSNLEALRVCQGQDYIGKYARTADGKFYKYDVSSEVLTTLLASLLNSYNELGEKVADLYTTVNEQSPDKIRLQASKGTLEKVAWTNIGTTLPSGETYKTTVVGFDNLPNDNAITNGTVSYGDIYRVQVTEKNKEGNDVTVYYYYRADYPTSTGFLNILNDNLNFGIARNTDGNGEINKATFNMYFGKLGSTAELSAKLIVLDGDTIADAIAAKYLNIDNYTYLFGKYGTTGSFSLALTNRDLPSSEVNANHTNTNECYPIAMFGAGSSGTTKFNSDGSGWLAGGLIKWGKGVGVYNEGTNNFGVEISGHISARSGWLGRQFKDNGDVLLAGWEIGTLTESNTTYPALIGWDSQRNHLDLTTEFLQTVYDGNTQWKLHKDGSGFLGLGNISWTAPDTNGIITSTIKGHTYIEHAYIGSGGNDTYKWEIGTLNSHPFILGTSKPSGNEANKLIISPDYINGGRISGVNPSTMSTINPVGWFLDASGAGYLGKGNIAWNETGDVNVTGNITAKSLKLVGDDIEDMNMLFTTYNTNLGNPTNGSTINVGDPVLFGTGSEGNYVIPLLKLGGGNLAVLGPIYPITKTYIPYNGSLLGDEGACNIYSNSDLTLGYYSTSELNTKWTGDFIAHLRPVSTEYNKDKSTVYATVYFPIPNLNTLGFDGCPYTHIEVPALLYPIYNISETTIASTITTNKYAILRENVTCSWSNSLLTVDLKGSHTGICDAYGLYNNSCKFNTDVSDVLKNKVYLPTVVLLAYANNTALCIGVIQGKDFYPYHYYCDRYTLSNLLHSYTFNVNNTSGEQTQLGNVTIENNLNSTSTTNALSAALGKVLNDKFGGIRIVVCEKESDYPSNPDPNTLYIIKETS